MYNKQVKEVKHHRKVVLVALPLVEEVAEPALMAEQEVLADAAALPLRVIVVGGRMQNPRLLVQ
jgi:hypothetical protein